MATTTNYGWTTPDDTALVKDGAAAIRSLGSAIDTSLNTALGTKKAGLVLLNTTSFSAVASQSVNTVFSSTYENYKIVIDLTASTDINILMRMRVSGADNSTANYNWSQLLVNNTTVTGSRSTSGTSWQIGVAGSNGPVRLPFELLLTNPFASLRTGFQCVSATSTDTVRQYWNSGWINLTDSFDSYSLIASSGNITGAIYTYGFNK